ncbi:MAG: flagellar export protein FliJ [Treponema sp.]|nr:flagellar export protein FliJ [Treponema sp.]
MKSFKFDLEKVLKLRKFREEEAKVELGKAIGILSGIESNIKIISHEMVRAQTDQFSPGNSVGLMQQYMYYLQRLDLHKEELLKEAALAELKVQESSEIYIEASRERKVIDKIKEKRLAEYRKDMIVNEGLELDEVSSSVLIRSLATA